MTESLFVLSAARLGAYEGECSLLQPESEENLGVIIESEGKKSFFGHMFVNRLLACLVCACFVVLPFCPKARHEPIFLALR
jgi:hypothetical protein